MKYNTATKNMKTNTAPQNVELDQPAGWQAASRPRSAAGLRSLQEERDYHKSDDKRRLAFETMPLEAYSGQGLAGL